MAWPLASCHIKILDNWRSKRIIDPQKVDEIMSMLNSRKIPLSEHGEGSSAPQGPGQGSHHHNQRPVSSTFARNEIFKRIEEDRERHKRLRERRWVQPISHNPNPHLLPQLASFMPFPEDLKLSSPSHDAANNLTIDIEFDNEWEATSDWNEDDEEAVAEENMLSFPELSVHTRDPDAMDVS